MGIIRASLICALVLTLVAPAAHAADPLHVTLPSGQAVQGVDTGTSLEWRGVPYAAPPVGALRWRPPQAATPWVGTLDATEFAPVCSQIGFDPETQTEFIDGSEDCLYLNVFAPTSSPSGPLPVMVHLHPGSNWGFRPYQDADAFVSKDVIVVTVGYRLGVFGFVGHPALTEEDGISSGEYGLFDQIAALEWVRDNISAFGGDEDNVTLFGESAGSFDGFALVVSPLSQGLFHKAALQTEWYGALHGEPIAFSEDMGLDMSAGVGCTDAPDVPACLRATPRDDLVWSMGFDDVVPRVGGAVLPESVFELLPDVTIPLLIGSNREECVHCLGDHTFGGVPYGNNLYTRDTNSVTGPQNGKEIRRFYPKSAFDSALWATVAAFTDASYTCPMRQVGLATDAPVYRYLYTHRLENNEFLNSLRAAHFLDEPILWNDSQLLAGFGAADYERSPDEDLLAHLMSTYWTNFAKTGDPNGVGLPIWPAYVQATETIMELDTSPASISNWRVAQCNFFDSLPAIFAPPWVYTPALKS